MAGKIDFYRGWGISRMFLTDLDREHPEPERHKYQMGINAGVVYNVTPNLHVDLEYFRAEGRWWLGESQVLHCSAARHDVQLVAPFAARVAELGGTPKQFEPDIPLSKS